MANLPSIEVPQGAIRFNTDSQKLEFFAQDRWYEMATETSTGLGGRAFRIGGGSGGNIIETWNIATEGNAIDTGFDLSTGTHSHASAGSRTRAVQAGGRGPSSPYPLMNTIQYFEMTSISNSIDFGDLTGTQGRTAGVSNQTRMVNGGGQGAVNTMNLITIQTTGNASDFGDLANAGRELTTGFESPTRGIIAGGNIATPSDVSQNAMDFVTFSTTGGAVDFGDLSVARYAPAGMSNNVRGAIAQGAGSNSKMIDFVTIASTGNAQEFGEAQESGKSANAGFSSPIRCGFFGGYTPTSKISVININQRSDSTFFGDLSQAGDYLGGMSDVHGGL